MPLPVRGATAMHISEVMAEYLQELETQYETQATLNEGGSLYAQGGGHGA